MIDDSESDVCVSIGNLISDHNTIKLYDVSTFDVTAMIKNNHHNRQSGTGGDSSNKNKKMIRLGSIASFFRTANSTEKGLFLAVGSSTNCGEIYIYSMNSHDLGHIQTLRLHASLITSMVINAKHHAMYSADANGILEIWDCSGTTTTTNNNNNNLQELLEDDLDPSNNNNDSTNNIQFGTPCYNSTKNGLLYTSKAETPLYQLVKHKTHAISMCINNHYGGNNNNSSSSIGKSSSSSHVFIYCADHRIQIDEHATGNIVVTYDERLKQAYEIFLRYTKIYNIDSMDYGKRAATENEIMSNWLEYVTHTNNNSAANNNNTEEDEDKDEEETSMPEDIQKTQK